MVVQITPNVLAYLALAGFFPLTLVLFRSLRPTLAAALTILLGTAFLPEFVVLADFPLLPPADKNFIVSFSVLAACLLRCRRTLIAEARTGPFRLVASVMLVATLGTFLTNRDPQVFGSLVLPGLTVRDVPSMLCRDAFLLLVPFFVARALFRTAAGLRDLLVVVVAMALVYAPFVVVELRMSPQFHNWTYGFIQQSLLTSIRGEGWRPLVFMRNGLAVTLFLAAAVTAAAALARARVKVFRVTPWVWVGALSLLLLSCRSLGSAVYGLVSLAVVSVTRGDLARRLALGLAVTTLLFPVLRASRLFPTEALVSAASAYSEERAQSLEFRFDNEDILVERALHRPLFGWGGFGRSRVITEEGRDVSVTDGWWVIWLGERGALGFLLAFGMITLPVLVAYRRVPSVGRRRVQVLVEALTFVVAVHGVDLLPNGLFSPCNFFFAGALSGLLSAAPPTKVGPGAERRPRRARG